MTSRAKFEWYRDHLQSGATIGGTSEGAGNVIAGNLINGIDLEGTVDPLSASDLITGNTIGGESGGNVRDGIFSQYTSGLAIVGNRIENNGVGIKVEHSIGTTIGGSAQGAGNVISGNLNDGVDFYQVMDLAVVGNTFENNGSSGVYGSSFSGRAPCSRTTSSDPTRTTGSTVSIIGDAHDPRQHHRR